MALDSVAEVTVLLWICGGYAQYMPGSDHPTPAGRKTAHTKASFSQTGNTGFLQEIRSFLLGEDSRIRSHRAAIVVAHPDDETVGVGARIARLAESLFIYVTDGAPRDGNDARARGFRSLVEYRDARQRELREALRIGGLPCPNLEGFGYPDQQSCQHLPEITLILSRRIAEQRIQTVFTHAYEGGHPDHDATAFAVNASIELLRKQRLPSPRIVEMASYHQGPIAIETGTFLPVARQHGGPEEVLCLRLSAAEQRRKKRLFACFVTQRDVLSWFTVEAERFRIAPRYDFSIPPHAGRLLYEQFPWGVTGEQFRFLAQLARRDLRLEERL
jgi:N-acetylglucosamine malate deacetylase 2